VVGYKVLYLTVERIGGITGTKDEVGYTKETPKYSFADFDRCGRMT
jgi:hypothetical protein